MGVVLYRPGDTHEVNGILCELMVFDPHSYRDNLRNGWVMKPEECYPEETEDDIRAQAKAAKIKNWHTKSIKRLKDELNGG